MSVDSDGELAEADRQELIRYRNDWPTDFDGSAHLSIDGMNIPHDWPKNLDAELINGRLRITFLRKPPTAVRPDFGTMEFQPHTTVKSKPNAAHFAFTLWVIHYLPPSVGNMLKYYTLPKFRDAKTLGYLGNAG